MANDEQFKNAIAALNNAREILITSHIRPDGDACGSMAAITDALTSQGKKVHPLLLSPLPEWYAFLFPQKVPILGNDISVEALNAGYFDKCDLVIVVDTNSWVQLPQFENWLRQTTKPVIVIDHHVTRDGVGNIEIVDTSAAAAGQIVLELFRQARWPLTKKSAEALFVSLSTDTGWFRFSNTDSRVYRDAAELIEAGAGPERLYQLLYQNFSISRMKLMATMLNNLEFHFANRLAVQHLLWQDFERTGATGRDTENLIDESRRIATVEAAVLFVELKDGGFRCSMRSRGNIDVQVIAIKHGGGGHKAAAGVNLKGTLEEVKKLIVGEFEKQIK